MFTNPRVNEQFRRIFAVWSSFLSSPQSRYVLHTGEDGWFGPMASKKMPNFAETFICDPSAPYHGFTSWDDFFTRRFRPGVRPVASPDNDDIITNACESTVYRIATNVQAYEKFWLKGQPYSLRFMLDNDPIADQFVGGTIYQAFLSAVSYHRWHSPVSGVVKRIQMVPGTYYAECPGMGFDPVAQTGSQAYLTSVACRANIYIEADNPGIGLMCFMAVGMAEVSTCEVTVKEGQRIVKGDELGMFHFGGSTHCLIFRPVTKIVFLDKYSADENIPLNAAIAMVVSERTS